MIPLLGALAVAGGCAAMAGSTGPSVASLTVPLDAGRPDTAEVGALRFRGALELPEGGGVGGLSGLWVSPDGGRFLALSDLGKTLSGRLTYDAEGRLTGAGDFVGRILPVDEDPSYRGRRNDSEEVVRLPDGSWLVSFERNHRILRYAAGPDRPEGAPVRLPTPPGLEAASPNSGIEAMTLLADGRLLAIEEGDDNGVQERRAWIGKPGIAKPGAGTRSDWQPLTYRAAPRFRPTGAAALPDGGALVLERRVSLLGGWAARIVHVRPESLRPGATMDGVELARLEPPLLVDNFEGIAVRPGPDGDLLVYIVSDDNRSVLQRTYLAMFSIPAKALRPAIARR
ncbi:esterase-like activity of phytase family protein [Azospirillum sp. sgz302134]